MTTGRVRRPLTRSVWHALSRSRVACGNDSAPVSAPAPAPADCVKVVDESGKNNRRVPAPRAGQ